MLEEEEPILLKQDLTVSQRMISASTGSFLTAFILTPFDVIRIRMQQQEIMPPCDCDVDANGRPIHGTIRPQSGTKSTLAGTTRVLATPGTKLPLQTGPIPTTAVPGSSLFWVDKNYCNSSSCSRFNTTFQGFVTISRHEGLATLWRGMSLTLVMAVPANVIYFTGYEYIRDNSPINGAINSLLCGATARLLAASAIAPLELLKTRLQSIPASSKNMLLQVVKDSMQQVRENGVLTLFKGLQITLWRDVPFSGIYWSVYEACKREMAVSLGADFGSSSDNSNDSKVFMTSFISGSVAGLVAAVATHPFDVGKTRMQISNVGKPRMFGYLYGIYRAEGIRALYGGLGPRVMKIAPACAIMISTYEISKVMFGQR